jgi:DnaD/phage-associated family protein
MGTYLEVLGISGRKPVSSEEKYLIKWMEAGYSPELVSLAYDQTILYRKEMNWSYLNAILRRWAEKGWRTAEDVEKGSRKPGKDAAGTGGASDDDWMRQYIKR